ncbi:AcrR family transcriptional regulator [Mucilaginibacter gracilis]|uniref:AcrR family transcriptional regulator n=1 Tax=Mucilaginibacter gracilis TaxID=423350 RepID=A0A495IY23_9SPHI|nr:TetR/AcrR family transcriptional regulator [Mucilaginibacter gracilis]RKR80759.1 AcrR family transcriptional regulator [Mucilaginibacter gracilis]
MITTNISPLPPDKVRQHIVDVTTMLICKNQIEQVSVKQIASLAKVTESNVIHLFYNLNNLIAVCLINAFDTLGDYIRCQKRKRGKYAGNIDTFWKMLVEFHCNYMDQAGAICHFLKAPAPFPAIAIKQTVTEAIAAELDIIEHQLRSCNNQVRFIAFVHLFILSRQLATKLSPYDDAGNRSKISNCYYSTAERGLEIIMKLPIR